MASVSIAVVAGVATVLLLSAFSLARPQFGQPQGGMGGMGGGMGGGGPPMGPPGQQGGMMVRGN